MIARRSDDAVFTAWATAAGAPGVAQFAAHRRSTQVGKTSSLVIPALLRWSDALVVTSVKNDVITTTRDWRASVGEVQVLEPDATAG